MTDYEVRWYIEVEADNPTIAARTSQEYIQDPNSHAHCFVVLDHAEHKAFEVDLDTDIKTEIDYWTIL